VVTPTTLRPSQLGQIRRRHVRNGQGELGEFFSFRGSLPGEFRLDASRTFAGFIPVTVYEYRR
jgi:hypothetical protein